MERSLNWTGILIEADQKAYSQLASRNRKAYSLPVCLSTKPYPVEVINLILISIKQKLKLLFYLIKVVFNASDWSGSFIVDEDSLKQQLSEEDRNNVNTGQSNIYKVQCFPLYSILVAVGRTEIDFFGLDVEGSEYKILKTIPWHKVDFKVG